MDNDEKRLQEIRNLAIELKRGNALGTNKNLFLVGGEESKNNNLDKLRTKMLKERRFRELVGDAKEIYNFTKYEDRADYIKDISKSWEREKKWVDEIIDKNLAQGKVIFNSDVRKLTFSEQNILINMKLKDVEKYVPDVDIHHYRFEDGSVIRMSEDSNGIRHYFGGGEHLGKRESEYGIKKELLFKQQRSNQKLSLKKS